MKKYRLGLIQMDTGPKLDDNLNRIEKMIAQAASEGARLVCLPETANIIPEKNLSHYAESPDGRTVSHLKALAVYFGLWIHGGSFLEKNPAGLPWNTSPLIDPAGRLVASYRKLHLFDVKVKGGPSVRESKHMAAGDRIVLSPTELGRFGLTVCYDLRFPELFRLMALSGAEVIFIPANFTSHTGRRHWESLLRARAIENACYVVAAGQCGRKPRYQAYGHSLIISPDGEILGELGDEEAALTVEIDLDEVSKCRSEIPGLQNRREDIYHLECLKNSPFLVPRDGK